MSTTDRKRKITIDDESWIGNYKGGKVLRNEKEEAGMGCNNISVRRKVIGSDGKKLQNLLGTDGGGRYESGLGSEHEFGKVQRMKKGFKGKIVNCIIFENIYVFGSINYNKSCHQIS